MKKWVALLLMLSLLLSCTACGSDEETPSETPAAVIDEEILQEIPTNEPRDLTAVGYWEMIRIDSDNPNVAVSEEEMAPVREEGIPMYLELMEDGAGVFCFEDPTAIIWDDESITAVGDDTFSYRIEGNRLSVDMRELVCVFRRADRPNSRTSEMEDAGYTEFMEEWVAYPYTTICGDDESKLTTGEATVIAYEIFKSAEGFEEKDGYEWRVATIEVRFFDENAQKYGCYPFYRYEDYYCTQLHDDTLVELDESEGYLSYAVNRIFCGQEVETYVRIRDSWSSWRKDASGNLECFYNIEFAFHVPESYDGAVAVLANGSFEESEDSYITDYEPDPERFLMFRLN